MALLCGLDSYFLGRECDLVQVVHRLILFLQEACARAWACSLVLSFLSDFIICGIQTLWRCLHCIIFRAVICLFNPFLETKLLSPRPLYLPAAVFSRFLRDATCRHAAKELSGNLRTICILSTGLLLWRPILTKTQRAYRSSVAWTQTFVLTKRNNHIRIHFPQKAFRCRKSLPPNTRPWFHFSISSTDTLIQFLLLITLLIRAMFCVRIAPGIEHC